MPTKLAFFSRSQAAKHAVKVGLRAFECFKPVPRIDKACWTYEERKMGPGVEYAETFMEKHDFIHHVEITEKNIPIIVVTCFKHEIDVEFPKFFKIEPLTDSLWNEKDGPYKPYVPPLRPLLQTGTPSASPIPKAPAVARPKSSGGRQGGAKAICRGVFMSDPSMPKSEYIRLCEEKGVFKGTAAARYTDILREYKRE